MSNAKVVDVIIRKTAEKTKLTGEGNLSVSISSPSVIEIQGSAQDVVRYVRQGNDLLIYMKDGSVIRCNNYFVEDTETHNHSELVFNDNQELTHISFADAGEASGVAATELTAQAAPISSIEPFLEQGSVLSDAPWGWIAGAALGGGAIGALTTARIGEKALLLTCIPLSLVFTVMFVEEEHTLEAEETAGKER